VEVEEPVEDASTDEVEMQEALRQAEELGYERAKEELSKVYEEQLEQEAQPHREAAEVLTRALDGIDEMRSAWARETRECLAPLVSGTLARLVESIPDNLEALVENRLALVLERFVAEKVVTIRVRPEDEARIREIVGQREGWTIVADPQIKGGLKAGSPSGQIDGTLERALEGIHSGIDEWLREGRGELESK
jgi:hypothetical protein